MIVAEPVFLVGAERSGTTLLRLMLDHHPEIAFHPEFEFALDFLGPEGEAPAFEERVRLLDMDRIFRMAQLNLQENLDWPDQIRDFLEQFRARSQKSRIGATVHRHFALIAKLLPEAKFIHLVRDPRDVAPSAVKMGWAGNAWAGAGRWLEAEEQWSKLSATLKSESYLEIRYEDLIRQPEQELARCCALFDLPFHPNMLRYPEDSTYSAPDPAAAERWRQAPSHQNALVEARVGVLLGQRGYAPSGASSAPPRALHRLWLALHDRIGRFRFRVRLYGLTLVLSHALAHRCCTRTAQRLQLRMQALDDAHLR